ncbi:MAG TPA: hypothetical protein VIK33_01165 [Anaerolineae bacterium]
MLTKVRGYFAQFASEPSTLRWLMTALALAVALLNRTNAPIGGGTGV